MGSPAGAERFHRVFPGSGSAVLDANGTPVTTVTSGGGLYEFVGLPPGDYSVQFVNPGGGYTFSPQGQGGDPTKDSDPDPASGVTDVITLAAGEENDAKVVFPSFPHGLRCALECTVANVEVDDVDET